MSGRSNTSKTPTDPSATGSSKGRSSFEGGSLSPAKPPRPSCPAPLVESANPPALCELPAAGTADRSAGVVDRRSGLDRRDIAEYVRQLEADMSGNPKPIQNNDDVTGLERRRGPGRRRTDFLRDAEEGQMNREQFLFLMAIEQFKKANNKMFPSWSDVLEVVRLLGYRKTMASELRLTSVEDWTEKPSGPSGVKTVTYGPRPKQEKDAA